MPGLSRQGSQVPLHLRQQRLAVLLLEPSALPDAGHQRQHLGRRVLRPGPRPGRQLGQGDVVPLQGVARGGVWEGRDPGQEPWVDSSRASAPYATPLLARPLVMRKKGAERCVGCPQESSTHPPTRPNLSLPSTEPSPRAPAPLAPSPQPLAHPVP